MNKVHFTFLLGSLFFVNTFISLAQDKVTYTLQDIVARAKAQSTAALRAQTIKENRFWQFRLYQSNYNPQLRLDGYIPS